MNESKVPTKNRKNPSNNKEQRRSNPLIRRLRIKFISMMMGVVLLFLLAIFSVQYISSKRSMESVSQAALTNALNEASTPWSMQGEDPFTDLPGMPEGSNNGIEGNDPGTMGRKGNDEDPWEPGNHRNDRRMADFANRQDRIAILVAYYMTDGTVKLRQNNIFFISSEDDITELVTAAVAEKDSSGRLESQDLRFMKKDLTDGSIAVAFADISNELSVLQSTLLRSLWISLAVTLVMFLLSLWFSRLATRPVERAWDHQRRFVADASHELKTPLTVIMSNTDMVSRSLGSMTTDESLGIREESPAGQKLQRNLRRMENVREESNRMKELIGELLDVARGDLGQQPENFREVSFSEIVEDALLTWESVYYESGKLLTGHIDPELSLYGDRTLLRRLVEILLDNALKYSSEKSEVMVSLRREKLHGKKVIHLSVENEGTPLTKEEISHLFDRFYRADSSREQTSGYGLGLSIAESITEAHKGQIRAEATERGNCFHVTIG